MRFITFIFIVESLYVNHFFIHISFASLSIINFNKKSLEIARHCAITRLPPKSSLQCAQIAPCHNFGHFPALSKFDISFFFRNLPADSHCFKISL